MGKFDEQISVVGAGRSEIERLTGISLSLEDAAHLVCSTCGAVFVFTGGFLCCPMGHGLLVPKKSMLRQLAGSPAGADLPDELSAGLWTKREDSCVKQYKKAAESFRDAYKCTPLSLLLRLDRAQRQAAETN